VSAGDRIEICWRARRVHPWDRDLPRTDQEEVYAEQLLHDTEAAIRRLFFALPQTSVIDFKVLAHESDCILIEGVVSRADLADLEIAAPASVRMRLASLGARQYLPIPD
jgi:hypothetical protein